MNIIIIVVEYEISESMGKIRLDVLLVEKGLAPSRSMAQRLTMAGEVLVDGQVASKPGQAVSEDTRISLKARPPYVSRGGEKLLGALEAFSMKDLQGMTCVDVGASTGGFTDCLLQHGAAKVYAVDVGYGQLHEKMRKEPRVVVMERTNARNIKGFPDDIDMVTVDASFISLKILLPVIKTWAKQESIQVIALIKPQFEVGRELAARGKGVIRDKRIHDAVVEDIRSFARDEGFSINGVIQSPLIGPKGNKEFLIKLRLNPCKT